MTRARVLLLCQGWGCFQGLEDGADEESFEAADGFAAAFSFGSFAFEVVAGGGVIAGLGDPLKLLPPIPPEPPPEAGKNDICRRNRLGGLIHEYYQEAA